MKGWWPDWHHSTPKRPPAAVTHHLWVVFEDTSVLGDHASVAYEHASVASDHASVACEHASVAYEHASVARDHASVVSRLKTWVFCERGSTRA